MNIRILPKGSKIVILARNAISFSNANTFFYEQMLF